MGWTGDEARASLGSEANGGMGMASVAMAAERPDGISVGAVFARAYAVIRENPLGTLGLTFALTAVPSLLLGLLGTGTNALREFREGAYIFAGVLGLVAMVLWLVASGALVDAAIAHDQGHRPTVAEQLRVGLLRSPPLFAVSTLLMLGIYFASLFLLIPGLLVAVRWAVAMPAVVAERTGVFGAFGRSNRLSDGARWQILGIGLMVVVVYVLVSMVTPLLTGASSGLFSGRFNPNAIAVVSLPQRLLQAVLNTLVLTWSTLVGTSMFIDLRRWKDGPYDHEVADIFS